MIRPDRYTQPLDRDANPRVYAEEFWEHARGFDFTRRETAEFRARFGMAPGCKHNTKERAAQ